ncbi:hypothetical protein [Parasedimentitalea psychrophila]|uniref:Uncharacterized protein n=1 Tax=Parasedimentitalea psychrophila TaxID=2997337 RepID=A0A9Y2KX90_9RHOB|nr:hypothetical protein [Parasedimentitalea psychrophila]WIY23407.1 hypothetical protein QPJ95_12105 [Parasedimentitalea psychrophila]
MFDLKTLFIGATLAGLATTASAGDAPFLQYGEVDGWVVIIDTEKSSCLIEKADDLGHVVQMGLTKDRGIGYVGVFTTAETDIKKGDTQAVLISLDGNLYVGQATGMRGNITKGYSGGYILSDDPQFVDDLARKYVMDVFPEKAYGFAVDLTGTYKAIELARTCNQEQLG